MIRYWEEDTEKEIGRPFDLEKHNKEMSNKWLDKVKQTRDKIQKIVDMCDNDSLADLNTKSGLGLALEKIDELIAESEECNE